MIRLLVAIIGIPLLLGGVALVLIGVLDGGDEEVPSATSTSTSSSTPTAPASRTLAATPTASPDAGVCAENPDPGTSDVVQVDVPTAGAEVTSPVTVSGRIAAFEATFQIRIYDANGIVLADQTGMSAEGQTLAVFSEDVLFTVSEETPACIWVYEFSARDGSRIHVIQIPVVLQP